MNFLVIGDQIVNPAHLALVERQGTGLVLHLALPVPSTNPPGQGHVTVVVSDPEEASMVWDTLTVPGIMS